MDIKIKIFLAVIFLAAAGGILWLIFRERPVRWVVYYGGAVSARTPIGIDLALF